MNREFTITIKAEDDHYSLICRIKLAWEAMRIVWKMTGR